MIWSLVTAAEMRELDRHTIEDLGVRADVLMESAGRAVAARALAERVDSGPVVVVCGRGNNGGDGLVAARHLHQLGVPVRAAVIGNPDNLSPDAAANYARALAVGVAFDDADWEAPQRGVVVDALFGTGLSRELDGAAVESVRRMTTFRERGPACRVVAVDLPSGLDADTGAVLGVAVTADCTVTIGCPKRGLALEPGRSRAGRIEVAHIGIAESAPNLGPFAQLWTSAAVGRALPERPAAGHKGTFGHALIVAGSEGKSGAAALAADGAARTGAGLVTIACPAGLNDILEIKCTEAMTVPLADTPQRAIAASGVETAVALAATRAAVGLGPGVGRSEETQAFVTSLVKRVEKPLAIDADGLFPFRDEPALLASRSAPTLLTPHPGEAATLLGVETAEINRDRPRAASELAARTGSVVALKGAATLIAAPDGRLAINASGGPALGTGGTGDVLLGIVTALLGQGLAAFEAAVMACHIHGAAGDRISARRGVSGLLAGELAAEIPPAMAGLRASVQRPPGPGAELASAFPEP